MSRSNQQNRVFHALGLLCFMFLMNKGFARDIKVGGSKGWGVSTGNNSFSYSDWAESNRFQIGDSLVFVYQANQDSVLHVNSDSYVNCNTDSPIEKYTDGHTSFMLNQSGPFYFISGNKTNCLNKEKLLVVVLADRTNHTTNQTVSPPPPPPTSPVIPPSPAPVSEAPPSPPPATGVVNTAPAPSEEAHPPNAGSSNFMSMGCTIGAFGASLFMVLLF